MIIVNIKGGLGNQMFQYAFAYSLARRKNIEVKLDISSFDFNELREFELDSFNISLPLANIEEVKLLKYKHENLLKKLIIKIKRKNIAFANTYYKEPHFNFDKKAYDISEDRYLEGYWQSEKYFVEFRDSLLKEFSIKNELHKSSAIFKNEIENSESISLHIRRGDYVSNAHTNSVHGTCSLEYYVDAVKEIQYQTKKPRFFVFSDDLEWARKNLKFIQNITFVDLDKSVPDCEEMILMSLCKHNIIANSSFSWWGAWLNENQEKIVIAPKQWFRDSSINISDLIPDIWMKL